MIVITPERSDNADPLRIWMNQPKAYSDLNPLWKKVYEVFVRYVFLPSLNIPHEALSFQRNHFFTQVNRHYRTKFWPKMERYFASRSEDYLKFRQSVYAAILDRAYLNMPSKLQKEFSAENLPKIWNQIETIFDTAFPGNPRELQDLLFNCLKGMLSEEEAKKLTDYASIMYKEISISVARSGYVKCMVMNNKKQLLKPAMEQEWIVYFFPNGQAYEENLCELKILADRMGKNLIAVNYRGVNQKDVIPMPEDFENDGRAVIEYLLSLNVRVQNITTWGKSLGGCVALNVAQHYPEMSVVADKTFTTYLAAVKEMFQDKLLGIGNLIIRIICFVVHHLGLNLNAWSSYQKTKGPKYMIDHPQDGVVREGARLGFKALNDWEERRQKAVLSKPVVILDQGHAKMTHGDFWTGYVMNKEAYGAHVVSWLRSDSKGQWDFSDAYKILFTEMQKTVKSQ